MVSPQKSSFWYCTLRFTCGYHKECSISSVSVTARFQSLFSSALLSPSCLIRSIFIESSLSVPSFTGYNCLYGAKHVRYFKDTEYNIACSIRLICSCHGYNSCFEPFITYILVLCLSANHSFILLFSLHLCLVCT